MARFDRSSGCAKERLLASLLSAGKHKTYSFLKRRLMVSKEMLIDTETGAATGGHDGQKIH
jgi:hypothetical protein